MNRVLDRLDTGILTALQDRHDALAAQRVVLDLLLGTGIDKGER